MKMRGIIEPLEVWPPEPADEKQLAAVATIVGARLAVSSEVLGEGIMSDKLPKQEMPFINR